MNRGIAIIRKHEGLKLRAYECPASLPLPANKKFWSIGYGATFYENGTKVQPRDVITMDRADKLLHFQVRLFADEVRRTVKSNLNDNQLGALVSFCFNVGGAAFSRSTLARKANANPNDPTIRAEFMRWTRGGGKVLPGLVKRREEEANLYYAKV